MTLTAVADAIRGNDRFLLVTHENPDGDALGSIRATKLALDSLGKDSVVYPRRRHGHPARVSFLPLGWLERELPADAAERVMLALDCANASGRRSARTSSPAAPLVVDVDHHHDNTRFGADQPDRPRRLVDRGDRPRPARGAGVRLTPEIAEALYVALVTDTGRFQYTNTTKALTCWQPSCSTPASTSSGGAASSRRSTSRSSSRS